MNDEMVLKTQQWLNATYSGKTGYNEIPENGNTGWTTIYALLHALQIELGITATADNFGPSTISKFNARFPNGVQQQDYPSDYEDNIYGIIQGALWCKGYSTNASSITKHFYDGTGNAIKELKNNAGLADTSSTVTLNVMKALMSMDQFQLVFGGDMKIQQIQRILNGQYEAYIGLSPCDGFYSRQMNLSLIKVLQAIEGYSVEEATGNFGSGTKANLPIVPSLGQIPAETEAKAILLVRYALCCNGYDVSITSSEWDTTLGDKIEEFQGDMCLEQIRVCDTNTWMALLLSKGNPDREYNAADTGYTIYDSNTSKDRTSILATNGITIVGRYITGEQGKQLKFDETEGMINNGISFYPIFQRDGVPSASYFTSEQALLDAVHANKQARKHRIPENAIIYFAVDIDLLDSEIEQYAIPYFKTLSENLQGYQVGVYGTRNVCTKVMDLKYAVTCMVSDASTGYSGNMGFKMPKNWNIDQFDVDIPLSDDFYIDKNIYSGKFPVVTEITPRLFYTGKVTIWGNYNGRYVRYGGRKLKLDVRAIGADGQVMDDLLVAVKVQNLQKFPDGYCTTGVVYAKIDGKTYDLTTEPLVDSEGNPAHRDSIYISDLIDYRLEYYVCRKIGEGKYELVDDENKKVTVEVEVTTYYL